MESCTFFVQIFALIAYIALILGIVSGLLLDIIPIVPHIQTKIRILVHSIFGTTLLLASYMHIHYLHCTNFNFQKIYDPLNHFDILAMCGLIGFILIIFVLLTSFLRKYMNKFWWNNIHNLSYVLYILITIHTFFKGDDIFKIVSALSLFLLCLLFFIRWKKGNKLFY